MEEKICYTCKHPKPLSDFNKVKRAKDGYAYSCRECTKEITKNSLSKYQEANIDIIKKRNREFVHTLKGQIKSYRGNAVKRGLSFELTSQEIEQFYNCQCYYCNSNMFKLGIDRIDNNKGYYLANCVPCCTTCNFMKGTLTRDEFMAHLKKLVIRWFV